MEGLQRKFVRSEMKERKGKTKSEVEGQREFVDEKVVDMVGCLEW